MISAARIRRCCPAVRWRGHAAWPLHAATQADACSRSARKGPDAGCSVRNNTGASCNGSASYSANAAAACGDECSRQIPAIPRNAFATFPDDHCGLHCGMQRWCPAIAGIGSHTGRNGRVCRQRTPVAASTTAAAPVELASTVSPQAGASPWIPGAGRSAESSGRRVHYPPQDRFHPGGGDSRPCAEHASCVQTGDVQPRSRKYGSAHKATSTATASSAASSRSGRARNSLHSVAPLPSRCAAS